MKLISMLLHSERDNLNDDCIITKDSHYTRKEVILSVSYLIDDLRNRGIHKDNKIIVIFEHDELGIFFLAAASAMGLHLLMPYNLSSATIDEWINFTNEVQYDFVVYLRKDKHIVEKLKENGINVIDVLAHEINANDIEEIPVITYSPQSIANFIVLFTSGSTGKPKAISISESLVCQRIFSITEKLKFTQDAKIFMSGLFNNTTGVIFSFGALLHQSIIFIPENRNIEKWPAYISRNKITHIVLRPESMKLFVKSVEEQDIDLTCLHVIAYGGAAMPPSVLEKGRKLIGCEWIQGYGLSETYGPFCWMDEKDHRDKRYINPVYCIGKTDNTLEVAIKPITDSFDNIGEIILRGKNIMEGYYDVISGKVTPPDEWFATGDLGYIDDDDYLILKGRKQNIFISSTGHRIYPEEVESILSRIPNVNVATIVGFSFHENGVAINQPVACMSGDISKKSLLEIENILSSFMNTKLDQEKWPDWFYVTGESFPRSHNDKILKSELIKSIDPKKLFKLRNK
ncbi:class I adenylate-forming enzyme family protein [Photorhabdus viridis]|uniref:class I adenylate-forming enzyme family protein n=1 Tax=Photorhabdus viridis TaxID=3163327 RepID=UPI003306D787